MTHITLVLLAFVAANLPWFSDKLFYVKPLAGRSKNLAWCLMELIVLYGLVALLAVYAEQSTMGLVSPQGWEFYTVTFSMFLVFAFPGFIYKVLWK